MKVLLVKMSSLGDVVHALPAVTDAARSGVRFHWVVEEAFQAVPSAHPAVEKVLPIAWRRWRRRLWRCRGEMLAFYESLAGERYDLAIDSQGLVKSALAMKGARCGARVGFCRNSARETIAARFYDRCVEVSKDGHAVDRQRLLFAGALEYSCDTSSDIDFGLGWDGIGLSAGDVGRPGGATVQSDGAIGRSGGGTGHSGVGVGQFGQRMGQSGAGVGLSRQSKGQPGGDFIRSGAGQDPEREPAASRCVFLHGATWATKLYPEAMWIELARLAREAGLQVALPWGSPEERDRAERIAGASDGTLLPRLNLGELMEELRRARLVVGVDSGLAHLAGALGVPTVVIYGSTDSTLTGCRGSGAHNLQAGFPCSPCRSRTCRYRGPGVRWRQAAVAPPCYGELDPDRVWAAALETMDADRLLHI